MCSFSHALSQNRLAWKRNMWSSQHSKRILVGRNSELPVKYYLCLHRKSFPTYTTFVWVAHKLSTVGENIVLYYTLFWSQARIHQIRMWPRHRRSRKKRKAHKKNRQVQEEKLLQHELQQMLIIIQCENTATHLDCPHTRSAWTLSCGC